MFAMRFAVLASSLLKVGPRFTERSSCRADPYCLVPSSNGCRNGRWPVKRVAPHARLHVEGANEELGRAR